MLFLASCNFISSEHSVVFVFFFFKQKTAYEMLRSLVGSEMCIRDRPCTVSDTVDLQRKSQGGPKLDRELEIWLAAPPPRRMLTVTAHLTVGEVRCRAEELAGYRRGSGILMHRGQLLDEAMTLEATGVVKDPEVELGMKELWVMWEQSGHQEAVEVVTRDLLLLNPRCPKERCTNGLEFAPDGRLQSWNLSNSNLVALPESFGSLMVLGDLWLDVNKLSQLPESFGSLKVGGDLYICCNPLSTLPESFGEVQVRGDLHMYGNPLWSWPELPNVQGQVKK
eukprot:TRINITY_DN6694_c0_g1_i1.p1 TRINITY_DN6694_c0_g1~~TRINITY_DN6694_c0_g1_i1.p1  ORF type:complete len:280 (-),score=73.95 TRINITY_DN6694_c0_g1_i1:131-970(-)